MLPTNACMTGWDVLMSESGQHLVLAATALLAAATAYITGHRRVWTEAERRKRLRSAKRRRADPPLELE